MTPDERSLLTRFLSDLTQVRGAQKDPDAAQLIAHTMNASPDAPYLLVQHAILADQALASSQARIAELEDHIRRLPQDQGQGQSQGQSHGFLGGLFGGGQRAQPQGQPQSAGPWGGPQPQMVTPQTQPQQAGIFGGGAPAQPGGMGSFLRNAGTTAAGVAGGAFLFQGMSNLFAGGHGGGGFLGGGMGGGYGQPENVTINEYGDQGGGGGCDNGGGGGGYDDGGYDDGGGSGGGDFN